jgi:hypothetical protein
MSVWSHIPDKTSFFAKNNRPEAVMQSSCTKKTRNAKVHSNTNGYICMTGVDFGLVISANE